VALTVSIISLLTAPLWIVAGLLFKGGALFIAVLPGVLSLVLGFRALQLAATAVPPAGNKRGITSLVIGLLALVISLVSSGFGMMVAGFKLGRMDGRALRIRGRQVTARGSHDDAWPTGDAPTVPSEPPETRSMLAAAWEADARTEHASIAAFARLSLDLMAVGAPPHLVEACLNAALDEVRHARGAYSLASAYAGHPQGPGLLPEVATAPGGLARLATETLIDGCLGEGLAAACAREAAEEASDPVLKAHLSAVARDESRHAELAWDVLAFCLSHGGTAVRLATERALELCTRSALPVPASAPTLDGRLSPARIASLGLSVRQEVEARVRQLFALSAQRRDEVAHPRQALLDHLTRGGEAQP
jgi:ADP-ribose pyrophosphatase YjhB (NUDIX family)